MGSMFCLFRAQSCRCAGNWFLCCVLAFQKSLEVSVPEDV